MAEKSFAIITPVLGIKQDFPSIALRDAFLPDALSDMKNFIFRDGEIHRAKLRIKEFSQALPDTVLGYYRFELRSETSHLLLFTKRDIAKRNSSNDRLDYLTPQYSTGVISVENASTEIYGGINVDDCDDDGVAWVDGSGGDVTPARETTIKKENTASVKLTVAAGAGVEDLAYHDISSIDLSAADALGFWFRSTVALAAGDLTFKLAKGAGLTTVTENIDIPIIAANTWTWVELDFVDPSDLGAIVSIGIAQAVDKGAMTLYIDQIVAGDWEGQLNANDFITIGTTYSTDDTWYEVSAVTDTHITITAVYAGATAYQKAYLARQTYGGSSTDFWESTTFNNKCISTNGVDVLQVWTGSNLFTVLAGSPPIGKHLLVYENYVTLANLVVAGNPQPNSYAWCNLGIETDWTGGDAGSSELDDKFPISSSKIWQGFWVMFTERSINKIHFIGGDLVFAVRRITVAVGAWAPQSVIVTDAGIFFYSFDHTFRVFTGSSWPKISGAIDPFMRTIHPEHEKNIYAGFSEEFNSILFSLPDTDSSGNNNKVAIYDLKAAGALNRWSFLDIPVAAFGDYEVEDSSTWDTLAFDSWDTWGWDRWDTRSGFVAAPHLVGSDYSGFTFQMFGDELDNGSAYTGEFVLATDLSPKKSTLSLFKRVTHMIAVFRGEGSGTMTVSIKKDYAASFEEITNSLSLAGSEEFIFLDIFPDVSAKNFLIKFSGTNKFRFIGLIFPEFELDGIR